MISSQYVDGLELRIAELEAENAALREDAERWKACAEYQYGLRVYPDHQELAVGALDCWMATDHAKAAIDAARGKK